VTALKRAEDDGVPLYHLDTMVAEASGV
jgi:hypothetical protein